MLIDFSFSNFRSFKDKVDFTLRADSTKNKYDNTFKEITASGTEYDLLKTSVIYGANASGKSNFIKAFMAFTWLIKNSSDFKIDKDKINCYEPYELDINSENEPVKFDVTFLFDKIKYNYIIGFDKKNIVFESLTFILKDNPQIFMKELLIKSLIMM